MSDLPNLELLIKLLKMTTSANDAEALLFMRKANEQLQRTGWDWDKLLRGKVTVIADPFNSVPTPNHTMKNYTPQPAPKPAPAATPRPQYAPHSTAPAQASKLARRRRQKVNVTLSDLGL